MAIEAFVLPYLGRSAGVVFWEPTRAGTREVRRRGAEAPPEQIEVYAPDLLSAGEAAELETAFVASLGRAFAPRRREGPLLWWWILGIAAAILLALGVLEAGLGYVWIAFVAALTALPFGVVEVSKRDASPSRRESVRARRLARRLGGLRVVPGTDPRQQERVAAIWRVGRRAGMPGAQLTELEAHCREQAWPAVAGFYAEQRRRLEGSPGRAGEDQRRGRVRNPFRRPRAAPAHAMVEMPAR
jgi:hypothetical protein